VQSRLGVRPTGFYNRDTKAAVSRFQRSLGWRGRGNVGRHTWARLF
jgi:peptidoglycan hydrolase-like protein with peptidoglycan-binding domain